MLVKKICQHVDAIKLLKKHNPEMRVIDLLVINAKGAGPLLFAHIGSK
jgi:hypothetical protein